MEAKRRGRKFDSDAEDDSDSPVNGNQDPYFKHDEDVFEDPFFKVCKLDHLLLRVPAVPLKPTKRVSDTSACIQDAPGAEAEGKPEKEVGSEAARRAERKAKKLAERTATAAAEQKAAELELLLMDDAALKDASKIGEEATAYN